MNLKSKSNIIIHSYSVGSAIWSALTAVIPVIGPGVGDTLGLTAITTAMAYSLAELFGKKIDKTIVFSFGALMLGSSLGFSFLRAAISVLHGVGSAINAAITFSLQEATGWGIYLFLASGGDLKNMTKDDLTTYIARGKAIAQEEQKNYQHMLSRLPPEVRDQVKKLQRSLANRYLSKRDRETIIKTINSLFEPYVEDDHPSAFADNHHQE